MDDPGLDAALDGARSGDAHSFALLYRTLQPALVRYLRVVAGQDADDVAAETWVSVVRDLSGFSGDASAFRAWLFTVARHRWVDEQRRRERRPVTPVDEVPEQHSGSAPDPADLVATEESTRAALTLIAALPPAQAEAVFLRAVAGLEVAAVAEIMGRTPGSVRVLAHRGLRTLVDRITPPDASV